MSWIIVMGDHIRKTLVVEKPWGIFKRYTLNNPVTVKILTVNPGQRLSKQSHRARDELWVLLDDGAEVEVGKKKTHPKEGDEVWIPHDVPHRLSSMGGRIRVLEISFGNFDEEDIIRYEDKYGRANGQAQLGLGIG